MRRRREMTSTEIPVGIWCWPGPHAVAGVQQGLAGLPVLAMFLDPVNLVLTSPPFPNGPVVMARFLRELARAASRMAIELDPAGGPFRDGGAHRALPHREAGSGDEQW